MEKSRLFWEQTYREHAPMMLGACLRYVPDRQQAEDLMHDAFLSAIHKAGTYDGRGCLGAWLRRIAVNTALMHLRGQRPVVNCETLIDNEYTEPMEQDASNDLPASADMSHQQLLDIIGQLPQHHRMVFNLYVIDDYSHEQIAQELGITKGTSKSHLARARKHLRQLLMSREPAEQRRRLPLLFVLPFGWNNVDAFFKSRLAGYSAVPDSSPGFMDRVDWKGVQMPQMPISASHASWKPAYSGIAISTTAILATGIYFSISNDNERQVSAPTTVFISDSTTAQTRHLVDTMVSNRQNPPASSPQVIVRKTIVEHQTVVVRDTITIIDSSDAQ